MVYIKGQTKQRGWLFRVILFFLCIWLFYTIFYSPSIRDMSTEKLIYRFKTHVEKIPKNPKIIITSSTAGKATGTENVNKTSVANNENSTIATKEASAQNQVKAWSDNCNCLNCDKINNLFGFSLEKCWIGPENPSSKFRWIFWSCWSGT